ncbi:MAG: type II toxin-antitoxin system VapC family toxin [Caulobacterales bacterium]
MIVVDASALVAIGDEEPDADDLLRVVNSDETVIAGINYVEAGLILIGRRRLADKEDLDRWLGRLAVQVHTAEDLAGDALQAYLRYGRAYHRARLNLGDCFAYALAKSLDAPLLYKGDDFTFTDIRSALQPT